MRPVHLSIEGLACFKEQQEVDFNGLDLFAISGPTGAGKSTLLDAILFALYGEVPRVGKHDLKEMIAAGRERVSVRFDFDVGDSRFRIARALRRKGSATVRLEEHDGRDFNKLRADKVGDAAQAVKALLGLDVDAFKQAIILPQGEFARFLKADPRKRREMLRTLLRLDVYERMRQRATEISTRKRHEVDALEQRLGDDYGDVSGAALADLQRALQETGMRLEALREESAAAEHRLIGIRERHAKTVELAKCEARLADLRRAAPKVDDARGELDAAQRAATLVSPLEEADLAARTADRARSEAELARQASEAADREHAERAQEHGHAEERWRREVPALRDRVAQIDRILGRLPEARRLEKSVGEQRSRIERLTHRIEKTDARLEQLGEKVGRERTAMETAQAERDAVGYDAPLHEALDQNREAAARLAEARAAARREESAREQRRAALDRLTESVDRLTADVRAKDDAERHGQETLERSEDAMHAAHRSDAANHLRGAIEPGTPCPVCTQLVADPPPAEPHPGVAAAVKAHRDARRGLQRIRGEAERTRTALARAESDAGAARQALAETDAAAEAARAEAGRLETEIRSAFGGHAPTGSEAVEVWFGRQMEAALAARGSFDAAQNRLNAAERALRDLRQHQELARNEVEGMRREHDERSKDLAADQKRLRSVEAEIAAVTQAADPEGERAAAAAGIRDIESRRQCAAEAAAAAQSESAAKQQARADRSRAAQAAEAEATARIETRDRSIAAARFASVDDVRAAVRDDAARTRLAALVADHERDLHAVDQRAGGLRDDLGDDRVTTAQLEDALAGAQRLQEQVERLVGKRESLGQQVETMQRRLRKAEDLRERLRARQADYRLFNGLAADLRSDRFQAYLLEESFTDLARGASDRLLTLSAQRYSLEFRDDQILVIDHDNAGEARISDTLSGGETFLTSLSLALEISRQVQDAAGAVHLDSLFIDEGFGTLDPDTLATVSETIQSLQVAGRMVGIITHIPELRDEFAQQIQVTKHPGYSTVQVRRSP